MSAPVPALLRCLMPPGLVLFDFNPDRVVMSRTADTTHRPSASRNSGTPAGASGTVVKGSKPAVIKLSKVMFSGLDTKTRADQLLDWMSPGGGGSMVGTMISAAFTALTGINLASRLPVVTFQWGPPEAAFMYDVNVTNATITYTRFAPSGIPVRALVDITLQEQPSLLGSLFTNPTSGGLPGRAAHTVTAGESLPGIATARYGAPGRWRELAARNGIDDPLRVRPGDSVYLPHPDELSGER